METVPMETSHDEKEDPLRRFDDREREVIQSQLRVPVVNVGYRTLYRYASGTDILVMSVCSFCAAVAGAVLPLMTVRYQASNFRAFTLTYLN
jgi:ATP-binding cassette subfamily B (MDR/TAP) protein 1